MPQIRLTKLAGALQEGSGGWGGDGIQAEGPAYAEVGRGRRDTCGVLQLAWVLETGNGEKAEDWAQGSRHKGEGALF